MIRDDESDTEPKTTTVLLAKKFDVPHKNVLRNLENKGLVNRLNIEPIDYKDTLGRTYKCYPLTLKQALKALPFIVGDAAFDAQDVLVDSFEEAQELLRIKNQALLEIAQTSSEETVVDIAMAAFDAHIKQIRLLDANDQTIQNQIGIMLREHIADPVAMEECLRNIARATQGLKSKDREAFWLDNKALVKRIRKEYKQRNGKKFNPVVYAQYDSVLNYVQTRISSVRETTKNKLIKQIEENQ
ncbi:TPA: hypothetical protein ACOJP5_000981 [Vibrio harveyi]